MESEPPSSPPVSGREVRDVRDVREGPDDREERYPQVVELIEPLRRYVAARLKDPADREDVVQETLTRVMELGREPALSSSLGYAVVVARHLIADRGRESHRLREQAHRLIDLRHSPGPEPLALQQEEQHALQSALASLPQDQRDLLLQHVVDERRVDELGSQQNRSSGSRAAQLARTRARLRLDYVLALRSVTLPTARCRPILLALSARDTRRQVALRAGQHLLACPVCAQVAPPLLERRRALAAVLPWLGLGPLLGLLRRRLSQAPVQTAAAMTVVVAAAGTGGALMARASSHGSEASSASRTAATRTVVSPTISSTAPYPSVSSSLADDSSQLFQLGNGQDVSALGPAGALASLAGRRVSARRMAVLSVPANEGFWIANATSGRVWVQLLTHGKESKVTVRPGDLVTFTGTVVINDQGFASHVGVDAAEGAALLTREGAHLSVVASALQLTSRKPS